MTVHWSCGCGGGLSRVTPLAEYERLERALRLLAPYARRALEGIKEPRSEDLAAQRALVELERSGRDQPAPLQSVDP